MTVEVSERSERAAAAAGPWHGLREAARATVWLGIREVRTVLRYPASFVPNLFMPLFFYFIMVASLSGFARRAGVGDYRAFQLPASILIAVMSGSAGLNLVTDIESGYFDKLLLTPVSRLSIVLGAMGADFLRIFLQGLLVTAAALLAGLDFATGVAGAVLMVVIASMWGLAYSAIGFALALKTGNSQATQSIWALFIPFFFLTSSFAPEGQLSGWLATAARFNPLTYVLRGLRALSMSGWAWHDVGVAVLTAAAFGALTLTLTIRALLGRIR